MVLDYDKRGRHTDDDRGANPFSFGDPGIFWRTGYPAGIGILLDDKEGIPWVTC